MDRSKFLLMLASLVGFVVINVAAADNVPSLAQSIDRLESLVMRLERVVGSVNHGSQPKPTPSPKPAPKSEPKPTPQRPDELPPNPSPKLIGEVKKILSARCMACHVENENPSAGFSIFSGKEVKVDLPGMIMIDQVSYSNLRHADLDPMPQDEYATIRVWINEYGANIVDAARRMRHQ